MLTKEEWEAKRQRRYERLLAAADRAEQESKSAYKQSDQMASVIPMGQPILVGHYSEKADRRYRERIHQKMRKGWDLHEKSERLAARAKAVADNRAIFTDDPTATEQIEAKIAKLEKRHEIMKAANKLIRKGDREALVEMGFTETQVSKLFIPDFMGRIGFPSYEITNNGANIRRLKERLIKVEKVHQLSGETETLVGDIRIVINRDINRLQIFFPGKPSSGIRDQLKRHGFHWSPSEGAWQRMMSSDAEYWANQIVKGIGSNL